MESQPSRTLPIPGWMEVVGRDGTTTLEELSDHELETPASRTGDMGKKHSLMRNRAPEKRLAVLGNRLAPKASSRVVIKRPRRGTQARPPPKKRNIQEQAKSWRARELEDAETEWARRGYPRIGWRKLDSRLTEFSPALRSLS